MTNNIVNINVSLNPAPAPSTLQQTGAFVSQGGTTNAVNSLTLLTQLSSLSGMLATPQTNSTLAWAGGTVTVTTTLAHNLTNAQVYYLTISGAVPAAYNGSFACTITGSNTFTYALASNPGNETAPGTWVPTTQLELQQMNTTFWAQGSNTPVYVLELGAGSVNAGVASLTTWLSNNPSTVYSFLTPREWDANAAFLALIASYESTTAQTYFYVTTTANTYTSYTALMKDVYAAVEAPGIPSTEFSLAADFFVTLSTNPSSTTPVSPLAFTYVFGVTSYPTVGNGILLANFKAAGVNYKGTASIGGVSNTIIFWGTFMSGVPWNYWFAIDWLAINVQLNMDNAVINGSNNTSNPLYLNQQGINTLQAVGADTLSSAITFGMLVGQVIQTSYSGPAYAQALATGQFAGQAVLNAVPFQVYYAANPSQFQTGTYNGFSCTVTPLRGFVSITFYITVSGFVAL